MQMRLLVICMNKLLIIIQKIFKNGSIETITIRDIGRTQHEKTRQQRKLGAFIVGDFVSISVSLVNNGFVQFAC